MKLRLICAAAALMGAFSLSGHHSFSAQYDASKAVRLVGSLTKIQWTNPHSYFYLDVKDAEGTIEKWVCEGAGPAALSRRGFKRGDIKLGDTLIVDGYRAKNGTKMIDARRVTLPDGRTIYGGAPGDGGPAEQSPQARPAEPAK